jgi:hypothetical protein
MEASETSTQARLFLDNLVKQSHQSPEPAIPKPLPVLLLHVAGG